MLAPRKIPFEAKKKRNENYAFRIYLKTNANEKKNYQYSISYSNNFLYKVWSFIFKAISNSHSPRIIWNVLFNGCF